MRHGDRWIFLESQSYISCSDDATAPFAQLHRQFQDKYNPEHELMTKGVHI
jgi:hypothetical protein